MYIATVTSVFKLKLLPFCTSKTVLRLRFLQKYETTACVWSVTDEK